MKYVLQLLLVGILLTNCGDDNQFLTFDEQNAIDKEIIENYIKENGLTTEIGEFGIHYIVEDPGTGTENPTFNSTVIVDYTGYFIDGEVFDEGQSAQFDLRNTIQGWQLTFPLYKKGGAGKIIVPSRLGYGQLGRAGIPPDQILIFDFKLLNFL